MHRQWTTSALKCKPSQQQQQLFCSWRVWGWLLVLNIKADWVRTPCTEYVQVCALRFADEFLVKNTVFLGER